MNFKLWLETEEFPLEPSEYDPPDESAMQDILKTPVRCDNPPSLKGDHYRFRFRLGKMVEFIVKFGGIVGLKAAKGSLNARCFELMRRRDCKGLYQLLQYVYHNNNAEIRRQILWHDEKQTD